MGGNGGEESLTGTLAHGSTLIHTEVRQMSSGGGRGGDGDKRDSQRLGRFKED